MKKITFFSVMLVSSLFSGTQIEYRMSIADPEDHIAQIEITVPVEDADTLYFSIPAWAPGRYVIYNFSKNIFGLRAGDSAGNELPLRTEDKQTWSVVCSGLSELHFSYSVFANTLDGTFSKITGQGASINGPCMFMYVHGRKHQPVTLRLEVPDIWQTHCALPPFSGNYFAAENYDLLIDSPIEMGTLVVHNFKALGKPHYLVFHRDIPPILLEAFIKDLKKVITTQAAVFNNILPYDHYSFFFHLDPSLEHTDGMEHLNACRVLQRIDPARVTPDANNDPAYDNLIWLSAHEFFHVWNIKRLRPQGLGPFDLTREVYVPELWFVEGLTSYYAYMALVRSGIYTHEKLYSEFAGRIGRYERNPAKSERTLRDVCILTWLFKGNIPQYEASIIDHTTYSYYYKGLIAGLLMDIYMRHLTDSRSSLDILIKNMWKECYGAGQKGEYFLPGKPYTNADILQHAVKLAGPEMAGFLQKIIYSRDDLPYSFFEFAGLRLNREERSEQFHLTPDIDASADALRLREAWLKGIRN